MLLDTGGGLKKAYNLFKGTAPILVHNVDILSNINFKQLEDEFLKSDAAALLVVKNRNTNRKLEFSDNNLLAGWRNEKTGKHITTKAYDNNVHALAFSGISVVSADFPALIKEDGVFGLIPACLKLADEVVIKKFELNHEWLDVGKPEVLPDAEKFIQTHYNILKMTFIQEIANKIINDFGTDFKSTAIVMPGRRGGLFMKKALAKAVGKPILLPHIFSIEEYIYHQSEMRKMDETTMLAILYAVYKNHAGQNAFSIDDFLLTGKTILSDFNDVDDYLLDPEDVFTYLMRVREIENWFPGEATTNLQKNYLAFYQLLKPIYYSFTDKCKELGMGYQGLASRVLSQKNSFNDFTKIIFVGLNAITPSLQTHINKLIQKEQAALYWDADSWYFDNPNHEAGHFLRLNRTAWPGTFSKAPSLFENTNKKINIIGAPLGYAQIQTALHILQSQYGNSLEDTVLVLANEGLMIPLLSSLPPELAEKVNISGGYPLKNTLLGQLIASYLELTSETFTSESSAITYHFDKLVEFLSNPLLRLLIEEKDIESYDKIVEEISSGKFRFFYWNQEQNESSELLKQFDELLPELISPCEKWESILARLIDVTSRLFEKCADIDIEHEAAWTINSMLKALLNTLKSYGSNLDITYNSAAYFIRRLLQTAKIPLKGEPLKGVQILGVLETRSLDFKNVIIVGANEGFCLQADRETHFYQTM